jgi:hypothetical protein
MGRWATIGWIIFDPHISPVWRIVGKRTRWPCRSLDTVSTFDGLGRALALNPSSATTKLMGQRQA